MYLWQYPTSDNLIIKKQHVNQENVYELKWTTEAIINTQKLKTSRVKKRAEKEILAL